MGKERSLLNGVYQEGITPTRQHVHLMPNLEKWEFTGTTRIQIRKEKPVDFIDLNAHNLDVMLCMAQDDDNPPGEIYDAEFKRSDEKHERRLRIFLPKELKKLEIISLRFDFRGKINSKLAGLYKSRYSTEGDPNDAFATSQCEEQDCCQIFPCFDHPAAKVIFDVWMDIPKELNTFFCTKAKEEFPISDNQKRVIFEPTPKMSSYLLYFAVGKFEVITDSIDPRFRAITSKDKIQYAGKALEIMRKAVHYCEEKFGVPYPLSKLDIIGVPEFMYGAMENWGILAHRENYMLYYPENTSEEVLMRIDEVINHEVVHQWFGNLVSPMNWPYIWLNESLATYFGIRISADYNPEWAVWPMFLRNTLGEAMNRDSYLHNHPIQLGNSKLGINLSTVPIIYSKGACILRQLMDFLGDEKVKVGLSHYLKKNQYSNTTSKDFFEGMQEGTGEPIGTILKSWIEQAGYPVIEVKEVMPSRLKLTQKKFTYLKNSSKAIWKIPVKMRVWKKDGTSVLERFYMIDKSMTLKLPDDTIAYKLNADQTGFYRVKYASATNMAQLMDLELSPEDKWGLESDLFSRIKSGDIETWQYLKIIGEYYVDETSFLPLISAADGLFSVFSTFRERINQNTAYSASELGRRITEKTLERIGYFPKENEPQETSILRNQFIYYGVVFGSINIVEFAKEQYAIYVSSPEKIDQGIRPSILRCAALLGNDVFTLMQLTRRLGQVKSETERTEILYALGSFCNTDIARAVWKFSIEDLGMGNKFMPIAAMSANPYAKKILFYLFKRDEEKIKKFPSMLQQRIIYAVCRDWKYLEDISMIEDYFSNYTKKEEINDVIKLALEEIRVRENIK